MTVAPITAAALLAFASVSAAALAESAAPPLPPACGTAALTSHSSAVDTHVLRWTASDHWGSRCTKNFCRTLEDAETKYKKILKRKVENLKKKIEKLEMALEEKPPVDNDTGDST
jgi:hypothetical protein